MGKKKLGFGLLVSSLALGAVACGGGGGSPASGFGSAEAVKNALASPTGTVSAESAVGVAEAFEDGFASGLAAGFRQKAQAQSQSIECSEGGSISFSGNETRAQGSYNNCGEGGCVINGSVDAFLVTQTETEIETCFSIDATMACSEIDPVDLQFAACVEVITSDTTTTVNMSYLVDYEGETFTVTGSFSTGSGTLTITGMNGSFTCSYTENAGSCTGSNGDSFEFTATSGDTDLESVAP